MTGRIDVLLPYYGDVELMQAAVRSVLAQDSTGWHLTVVDDCTPDPRPQAWFAALGHSQVTYVRNERNLGANANYRRALGLASADHVVFMGADDLMLPRYVSRVHDVLARWPGTGVVHPGVEVVDEHDLPVTPLADRVKRLVRPRARAPRLLSGEPLATSLMHANWTYFPALCWRRDAVLATGFRRGLDVVQDLALLVDLVRSGESLVLDPEVTFHYRRHRGSDSSVRARNGGRFVEEARYLDAVATAFDEDGWRHAARAARLRATSRLHAAAGVPAALRASGPAAAAVLVRHALSPSRPPRRPCSSAAGSDGDSLAP